jgi:hypothetical protein
MSVALAMTWNPRGETERFRRFYPEFSRWYAGVGVVTPPDPDVDALTLLESLDDMRVQMQDDWVAGRQVALDTALEFECDFVHYVDCDRLLRWFELSPDELRHTIQAAQTVHCLVIGRTEAAFATHPQCLQQTESITNDVFSHLLDQPLDLCAGSKAFSRAAAEFLTHNSQPSHGWCTDAEWIVLLHRAGFSIGTLLVDGLDWETADRYLPHAADAETQRRAAVAYDADPQNWEGRTRLARESIQAGLAALERPLIKA